VAAKKKRKVAKPQKAPGLPFGVGCLAFFMLLGSIVGLVLIALLIWFKKDTLGFQWPTEARKTLSTLELPLLAAGAIIALAQMSLAIGLFRKRVWAYYVYTIITGVWIGYNGLIMYRSHVWFMAIGILWQMGIAWYLCLPRIRKVFA
jgi:hypothetical protein